MEAFPHLLSECDTHDEANLLLRKGVYPYEYMDSFDRFEEQELPPINKFYSSLKKEHISDADYEHAQTVFQTFNMDSLGQYHDLYLKTDVVLLSDVFESFRNMSLKQYELDPCHFYTSPGLSWSACLKITNVQLELLTDIDKILLIETGIRGGVSQISHRYQKANNTYLPDYDPSQPTKFLQYLDANNLYSWSMVQPLLVRDFKFMDDSDIQNFDVMSVPEKGDTGYILEVSLEYPTNLHDNHNCFPLAPERKSISNEQLSPYAQQLLRKLYRLSDEDPLPQRGNVKKLLTTLEDKDHYVVHYRNLQLYLRLGMKLKSIHRILTFEQEAWMKPYINLNTEMRKKATSTFQKNFYKLLNNSVFGKTMENVRQHKNIELVHKEKRLKKVAAKPTYKHSTIFNEDLVAVELHKAKVNLFKPIYCGMCILGLGRTGRPLHENSFVQRGLSEKYRPLPNKGRGFPNVVGVVDGTQIRIQGPTEHEEDYVNRKGFHSINVQMICDARFMILDDVAKWPGSVHDSRIFRDSEVGGRLERGEIDGLLLGDSGYPCRKYLMTPYHAPQTHAQERFNESLCKTRVVVEQSFGVMKRRFPCLSYGLRVSPPRAWFAPIDGMCSELRSCIVNEDTGLSTAFTVAHEMGHNFGMMHDGDDNICKDTTGYIMSPTLSAQSGTFHWSPCSRQYMRKYLNAVQSECLTSHSSGTAELKFPNKQPGEIFDADTQCKWQFGSHSKQCTIIFGRDPCKNLFCHKRAGMCETKFLPAAEGTSCGNGMWCQQGKCVRYGKSGPTPINGWWTEWGQWSHCSRSCGGGIKTRTRECNNPRPQYGGKTCQGADAMHKMCNLHECEDGEKNFRAVQCEQLVHEKFRGWNYRLRTHRQHTAIEAEDQCKLYCKADGYNFYYAMPREVTDGTRCNEYTTDICVQGKCQHVGCDLIVSSLARKDRCGVCRGDNSTCKIVENTFTQQPRKNAYVGVVYLPRGSSSINIEEAGIAHSNYLALRDRHGEYHLNGNWKLDPEGVYSIAGTKFIYRRPYNLPESLVAEGPLLEDLVLEVLIQSENPGVRYSFTVPRNQHYTPPSLYNFTWSVVLTECSQPCAGGEQIVTAHCHRGKGEEVDPAYCSIDQKPGTGTYACNTQPCRPRWLAEPWSSCHKPCGGGHQKRRVYCVQKLSKTEERRVPRKYCNTKEKPVRKRECNTHECPPVWYKSPWSQCSASCGKGLRSRTVVCRSKTLEGQVVQPDSMCAGVPRPVSQKGCRRRRCPDPTAKWANTAWSECSRTCDVGTRSRAVKCMRKTDSGTVIITKEKRCKHLDKPKITLVEACLVQKCPELPEWYSSPWSTCSVSCGSGKQTRLVHCMHQKYRKLATNCDQSVKPLDTQTCFERKCLDPGPQCLDEFSWCYLVPKHNICNHSFYGTKCCRSCHKR